MKINKTRILLKLEKFFKEQIWQHIIVIAFICFCAWLHNKPFEAIMFCISHLVVRVRFDKQYHCGTTAVCLVTTLGVCYIGISQVLPTSISLLSAIPMAFVICWIGYLAQYKIDLLKYNNSLENELDELTRKLNEFERINLYKMSEDELRAYGASKMLSEIQQDVLVLRVKEHLKISEICKYRNYGRSTIKYHIAEISKKLNIGKI